MKHFGYVMATRALVDGKKKVGFMYREKSEGDDSGWRFFSGEEEQEYVDNVENIKIYDIQTILDIDRGVQPYLNSAVNSAFERDTVTGCFKVIEDFGFGAEIEEV